MSWLSFYMDLALKTKEVMFINLYIISFVIFNRFIISKKSSGPLDLVVKLILINYTPFLIELFQSCVNAWTDKHILPAGKCVLVTLEVETIKYFQAPCRREACLFFSCLPFKVLDLIVNACHEF